MARRGGLTGAGGGVKRAVLVYVEEYHPGVELKKRPGAKRDAKRLHGALMRRGFQVELRKDPSSEEIYRLYRAESRRSVTDVFLTVLSSHGDGGCVFGADGNAVQLSRIFAFFDNKNMENKTKLFLIQACRGNGLDDGVEVDSGGGSGHDTVASNGGHDTDASDSGHDTNARDSSHDTDARDGGHDTDASDTDASASGHDTDASDSGHDTNARDGGHDTDDSTGGHDSDTNSSAGVLHDLSLPVDGAAMFATSPGFCAFSHPLGSVFLQTFCDLLDDPDCRNLDLTRLMTRLAGRVARRFRAKGRGFHGMTMMPCFQMRLTREVFPFAELGKEGGASGIAATSLVKTEGVRKRNPSIS